MPKKSARQKKKNYLLTNIKWLSRDKLPTIISLVVLLLGLAAGVTLVQRQQEIREKAAPQPCRVCQGTYNCVEIEIPPYCNTGDNECFDNADCAPTPTPTKKPTSTPTKTPTPTPAFCPKDCVSPQSQCKPGTQVGGVGYGDCGVGEYCCDKVATPTPTKTPTPTGPICYSEGQSCANPDKTPFPGGCCSGLTCTKKDPISSYYKCEGPSACVQDGKCIGPGDSCCSGKSYFDTSCAVTETRCGIKPPTATPTKKPTPTPTPKPDYCTNKCCNVGADYPGCWVNHYWSWDAQDPVVNDIALCEGCVSACFAKDCGAEQIDVGCSAPGGSKTAQSIWIRYGGDCQLPTATPTPTLACLNIRAFDTNWNELTSAQLSQLKEGDKVRFTVAGSASSGTFDMARFRINSTTFRPPVTQKRPGTNEFFDEYTIPTNTFSFNVNAQVHHLESDSWI